MLKDILKAITILLSLSTFLSADSILILEKKRDRGVEIYCIKDHYYKNNRIYFLQSDDNRYDNERLSNYSSIKIEAGYILDNRNNCIRASFNTNDFTIDSSLANTYSNISALGIPIEYYNSLMALSGIITSFIFLYGLVRFI